MTVGAAAVGGRAAELVAGGEVFVGGVAVEFVAC